MMKAIIQAIQRIVRCYPSEAPESAAIPYAYYVSSETPIRTKDGIASYEGSLIIGVVCNTKAEVDTLAERIIDAFDDHDFDDTTLYYADASDSENAEAGLSIKELIFNTLR